MALVVKNPPASAGDVRDAGSIPGSERSPGEGHGRPLQYSSLENPVNRGTWQVTVYRVTKSWTRQKWLSTHTTCWVLAASSWEQLFSLVKKCLGPRNPSQLNFLCPGKEQMCPGNALWSYYQLSTVYSFSVWSLLSILEFSSGLPTYIKVCVI